MTRSLIEGGIEKEHWPKMVFFICILGCFVPTAILFIVNYYQQAFTRLKSTIETVERWQICSNLTITKSEQRQYV